MKNTELAFCKFSKYPILKSIRVKFSKYKQKSMNVSVSFDTLILTYKKELPGQTSTKVKPGSSFSCLFLFYVVSLKIAVHSNYSSSVLLFSSSRFFILPRLIINVDALCKSADTVGWTIPVTPSRISPELIPTIFL